MFSILLISVLLLSSISHVCNLPQNRLERKAKIEGPAGVGRRYSPEARARRVVQMPGAPGAGGEEGYLGLHYGR